MTLKELKLTPGNVLVEEILESEDMGGLVKPVAYEDKAYMGRVIKGSVGKIVFFNKYSSTEFPFEGKKYLMLKTEDIVAYLE